MKRVGLLCAMLVLCMLLPAACGNRSDNGYENDYDVLGPTPGSGDESVLLPRDPFIAQPIPEHWWQGQQVLRVAAPARYEAVLARVATALAAQMARENVAFTLEIITYDAANRDTFIVQMGHDFFNNMGVDIFLLDDQPLWDWARYLADMADIIALPPVFDPVRSGSLGMLDAAHAAGLDFSPVIDPAMLYRNVLDAFMMDDSLLALPLHFGHRYVGIAADMPPHFIEYFAALDYVTMPQLLDLYIQIQSWPGFSQRIFAPNACPIMEIWHHMGNYIDIHSRTARLTDPGFLHFLQEWELVMRLTQDRWYRGGPRIIEDIANSPVVVNAPADALYDRRLDLVPISFLGEQADRGWWGAFYFTQGGNHTLHAFYEMEMTHLVHFIPLVDNAGALRLRHAGFAPPMLPQREDMAYYQPWGFSQFTGVAVNAMADATLAREFISYLMWEVLTVDHRTDRFSALRGMRSVNNPIRRDWDFLLEHGLTRAHDFVAIGLAAFNGTRVMPPIAGENDAELLMAQQANMLTRLRTYNERPVSTFPMLPGHVHENILEEFFHGFISAQMAAEMLQSSVMQWMETLP